MFDKGQLTSAHSADHGKFACGTCWNVWVSWEYRNAIVNWFSIGTIFGLQCTLTLSQSHTHEENKGHDSSYGVPVWLDSIFFSYFLYIMITTRGWATRRCFGMTVTQLREWDWWQIRSKGLEQKTETPRNRTQRPASSALAPITHLCATSSTLGMLQICTQSAYDVLHLSI